MHQVNQDLPEREMTFTYTWADGAHKQFSDMCVSGHLIGKKKKKLGMRSPSGSDRISSKTSKNRSRGTPHILRPRPSARVNIRLTVRYQNPHDTFLNTYHPRSLTDIPIFENKYLELAWLVRRSVSILKMGNRSTSRFGENKRTLSFVFESGLLFLLSCCHFLYQDTSVCLAPDST